MLISHNKPTSEITQNGRTEALFDVIDIWSDAETTYLKFLFRGFLRKVFSKFLLFV